MGWTDWFKRKPKVEQITNVTSALVTEEKPSQKAAEEVMAAFAAVVDEPAPTVPAPVMAPSGPSAEEIAINHEIFAAESAAQAIEAETNVVLGQKIRAEIEQRKAESMARQRKLELEAKLAQLAGEEADARQAEYDQRLAEAEHLRVLAQHRKIAASRHVRAINDNQDMTSIKGEEVFHATFFSPGGDACVWLFKRVGADVIFINRSVFKSR